MATVNLTVSQLAKILPRNNQIAEWHKALIAVLPRYQIDTPQRVAAFLAQTAHESAEYTVLEENLYYSAAQLVKTWPKRFNRALAAQVAKQPRRIAEIAYGGRMGNMQPNDGYLFRGQGIIQLTGRDNFTRFGQTLNRTAEQAIEYIQTKQGAVEAAAWFWRVNNLNKWADAGDVDGLSDAINIGRKTARYGDAHGFEDRKRRYDAALELILNKPAAPRDTTVVAPTPPKVNPIVPPTTTNVVPGARPLRQGAKGELVRKVQEALNVEADGDYGPNTKDAVNAWQESQGVKVTGSLTRDQVIQLLS